MSTITVRVSPQLKRELEAICKADGRDLSFVLRESLQRLVAIHRFKKLRSKVLPFAERIGVFSDEDVFKLT